MPPPPPTDRFQYAYDRDGNHHYQADLVDAALSELYHANSASYGRRQHGVRRARAG
jgi:hypothetical protein